MIFFNFLGSFFLVIIIGYLMGYVLSLFKINENIGYLISGFLLGPYVLNILDINFLNIFRYLNYLIFLYLIAKYSLSIDIQIIKKIKINKLAFIFLPSFLITLSMFLFSKYYLNFELIYSLLFSFLFSNISYSFLYNFYNKKYEKYNIDINIAKNTLFYSLLNSFISLMIFYSLYNYLKIDNNDFFSITKPLLSYFIGMFSGLGIGYLVVKSFEILTVKSYIKTIIIILISLFFIYLDFVLFFLPFSSIFGISTLCLYINKNRKNDAKELKKNIFSFEIYFKILIYSFIGKNVNFNKINLDNLYIILLITILCVIIYFAFNILNKNVLIKNNRKVINITIFSKGIEFAAMAGLLIISIEQINYLITNTVFISLILFNVIYEVYNLINFRKNRL